MKIAYETNDAIQFHAHLNALRKFVATQVKKELPYIFEHRVLKFAMRIQQLQKARQNGSKKLPQLKQEIEKDFLAIQSIWLLEKINKLLSEKK